MRCVDGENAIHTGNDGRIASRRIVIGKSANGRLRAHCTAKVNGEGWGFQGVHVSHVISSVDDHPCCLDEREAEDAVYGDVRPTCHEKGGVGSLPGEIGHVELERHRELGCDGGTSLLDNAAQNDGVMIGCAVNRRDGMRECFCDCSEVI